MQKITYASILNRALSDCATSLREAERNAEEWQAMGKQTEAVFFHDNIVKPLREELAGLKALYLIETGTEWA